MVITERPSPPLYVWSFTHCVCCSFWYPLFLHLGVLHSPLACLVILGLGGAIRCLQVLFFPTFWCSHVCGPIHYCYDFLNVPLAATYAHDGVVDGLLSTCTRLLWGHTVFKWPGSLQLWQVGCTSYDISALYTATITCEGICLFSDMLTTSTPLETLYQWHLTIFPPECHVFHHMHPSPFSRSCIPHQEVRRPPSLVAFLIRLPGF